MVHWQSKYPGVRKIMSSNENIILTNKIHAILHFNFQIVTLRKHIFNFNSNLL